MEAAEIEAPTPAKKGKVTSLDGGPLDFQLSSTGLSVMGQTNSAPALKAFIAKLTALSALLPDEDGGDGG